MVGLRENRFLPSRIRFDPNINANHGLNMFGGSLFDCCHVFEDLPLRRITDLSYK